MQLNIGNEGVSYHIDVPFLITTDHVHHLIVGFSAIKNIVKESSDASFLNRLFGKAFSDTDISKIEKLLILFSLKNKRK